MFKSLLLLQFMGRVSSSESAVSLLHKDAFSIEEGQHKLGPFLSIVQSILIRSLVEILFGAVA